MESIYNRIAAFRTDIPLKDQFRSLGDTTQFEPLIQLNSQDIVEFFEFHTE
ncbi:hypothetical protein [Chitinivibrio alkaliphilus]|uniref:hypothetical protein n=1 Tax=Chitinivibrio alkaliphilus TaxID=1505232 RepID=UPI0003FDE111|nr:hypothetical protein [Chitinivibrio alkaliphilus]